MDYNTLGRSGKDVMANFAKIIDCAHYYRQVNIKTVDQFGRKKEAWQCNSCGDCISLNRAVENWIAMQGGKSQVKI